ncbi:MAG: hypothetical protein V1659_00835 [Candidatus Woesearchaeota archaeon]
MAKQKDTINLLDELTAGLSKLDERISRIENLSSGMVSGCDLRDRNAKDSLARFKSETAVFRDEIKKMNAELAGYEKNILVLSKRFKALITKDDVERLQSRVDEWPLELFVQKNV